MHLAHQKANVIFNKLLVNAIENTSGIFIGTNQAFGWSTYSKSNQAFGSVKDSHISNIVNVVNDQDVVDSPMAETKSFQSVAAEGAEQHCDIAFQSVNALTVTTQSAIAIGENEQNAWTSLHKNNYGTGKQYGMNQLNRLANIVKDNDYIDSPGRIQTNVTESVTG